MANVTNIRQHLTTYNSNLTRYDNSDYNAEAKAEAELQGETYSVPQYYYNSDVITSTTINNDFVVTSTDTEFSNDFTITDPAAFKIRTGLSFNFTSGSAIDFTIRISKPELLKLNEVLLSGSGNLTVTKKYHNVGFSVKSYSSGTTVDTNDNRLINYHIR